MEATPATMISTATRQSSRKTAFLVDQVSYGALINGYLVPLLVVVIVVCNLLVCVVLVRPNMRTATNAVLVAIAFSDLLTGLWPLPVYIWFFAAGAKDDWVPYSWCYAYFCLTDYLPTVFHTTSIWLTVLLAAQRYVCVCRGDLPRSGAAQRRSVVVQVRLRLCGTAVGNGRFSRGRYLVEHFVLFLVAHFNFLFVSCGGLSWLPVSFL